MKILNHALDNGLTCLESLVADARAQCAQSEAQRKLCPDLHSQLRTAGLYRILLPAEVHGLQGSLLDWYRVVSRFAAADPSAGWCIAHGAITSSILYAIGNDTFRKTFFSSPHNVAAWSNLSRTSVTGKDGNWRVSGRWSFVTGCTNASYVGGTVQLPAANGSGKTRVVSVLFPRSKVTIDECWNPVGLAGSGSHDVVVKNLPLSDRNIFVWPRPWREQGSDLPDTPSSALVCGTIPISLCCAATQLGIARAALDELQHQLEGKKDKFSGRDVAQRPHVLSRVESLHAEFFVLETAFLSLLAQLWESAVSSSDVPRDLRLNTRLGCVHTTQRCKDIVHAVFELAGSAALSNEGPLAKLFRDASCLPSHVSAGLASFETTSGVRYGLDKPAWL